MFFSFLIYIHKFHCCCSGFRHPNSLALIPSVALHCLCPLTPSEMVGTHELQMIRDGILSL